ncbi:uncharacterized protein LOC123014778 isoform X2 [Tribolium madens]|uniref:uncharacterized protein LOC123014778 isoform X2 n=1 Tax=Tribolium madens TaxID=41895 RepID=UPI001CF733C2|nr:uncharacterized protein LOC123014778 isoform X2 [Tribolium madens]
MECSGICRICGNSIVCKDGNMCTLGEHLLKNHPEISMTHFVMENCEDVSNSKTSNKTSAVLKKTSELLKGCKTNGNNKRNKNLYKTTVESWRPGSKSIQCPKCGNTDQPYIRKQRNKVAYNSLGAFFLLGCWPLCFLPMLMCGGTNTIICCRKCGYCFGTYDKKKGKLIPSTKDVKVETPNVC